MRVVVDHQTDQFPQSASPARRWGILTKRERWGLVWQGWLVLLLASVLLAGYLVMTVHPFLATTHRVDANMLVVEGWVHAYVIRAAVKEFETGSYQRVFATGGPTTGSGGLHLGCRHLGQRWRGSIAGRRRPSGVGANGSFAHHWPGQNLLFGGGTKRLVSRTPHGCAQFEHRY